MNKYSFIIKDAMPTGDFFNVYNPYNGSIFAQVERATSKNLEKALDNAHKYFYSVMLNMPAYKRADILYKVANFILQEKQELALTIAKEGGKPYKDALVEVQRAVITTKLSADESLRLDGKSISMDRFSGTENHIAYTIREPIGPVLAISAFNHPVNLICHQVATAFAAGNTVIVKPADTTPVSCLKIVDFFLRSGSPEGLVQAVTVKGSQIEPAVIDKRIKFITFIGGEKVGWDHIRRKAANGTKVALEHGGTAVSILTESADLRKSIPKIVRGAFYHAGQVCVSTQILYVHKGIYENVIRILEELVKHLKVGDPTSPKTDVGPLISPEEVDRVHEWVQEAIAQKAWLLTGGNKISNFCYQPTILVDTNSNMIVCQKEIFGPVLCLQFYENLNEVITQVNRSDYSFQASIYTNNISEAMQTAKKVETKAFMINESTAFRVDWMPFGGKKSSGLGTGGVFNSIMDMTEEKLIIINPS